MESEETYQADLELEAEIEAFLEDDDDLEDLTQPIWKSELTTALDQHVHDVDILKGIIGSRVLPQELRSQVWPSLLGVRGKTNSFSSATVAKLAESEQSQLEKHCRKFGEKASLAMGIVSTYLNSKALKYDSMDFVHFVEVLIALELSEGDLYNSFYALLSRHRPKSRQQLRAILDLLVQYFDPVLSRQLQVRRSSMTADASDWISSGFRNCLSDEVSLGLWDIVLQSYDSSLSVFIGLVFIMNCRDALLQDDPLPPLTSISLDDLDDLIQLAKYYQTKTPKSFTNSILQLLFANAKPGKNSGNNIPLEAHFVIPIAPAEIVKDVLNATAGIILDIRPEEEFERTHLIGSLRLSCLIDSGLMDGIKLRRALEKFSSDIQSELSKDEEVEMPFLTLIGRKEPESTMYTCANELVRIGFVGVSVVKGGFDAIFQEVKSIGSEDLLLWRNPEAEVSSPPGGGLSWISSSLSSVPLASNLSQALNSINSTLETMLTVDDPDVDDQF